MIMLFESCDDTSVKVYQFLDFDQLTLGRLSPHAQAVRDMWEHVRLNYNFKGF